MAKMTIREELEKSWMSENEEFDFPSFSSDLDADKNERMEKLRIRWDATVNVILSQSEPQLKLSDPDSSTNGDEGEVGTVKELWFEKLVQMHTEKERFYHTLCHLEEMFGFLDLIMEDETSSFTTTTTKNENSNTDMLKAVVDASVFFHDCVYNAKSSSNEEDSAQLFLQFVEELLNSKCPRKNDMHQKDANANLNQGLNASKISWEGSNIVHEYILATKSHTIDEGKSNSAVDNDEKLRYLEIFLDSDMAVLGKQPRAYEHYASLIRKEYAFVEHDMYCEKRADILESFIGSVTGDEDGGSDCNAKKKYIYLTASMRDALEEMAVENLKREIASLRKGIIPG